MSTTTTLSEIVTFLDTELQLSAYSDVALNGLQIESGQAEISKIAFAVDAGLSVIEQAVSEGAQLLVVHHGVFWGKVEPVRGAWARKLQACLTRGLSLYAAHLPLDGHPQHGNAAQVASLLGATAITPAFPLKGAPIGVTARLEKPTLVDHLCETLGRCEGALTPPLTLPFGKREISTIGVATGSATSLIPEAAALGLDLFITGEPKQEAYHTAKELGCSVVCMGHYASETFGVRALERVLASRFRVQTAWISEPTGI